MKLLTSEIYTLFQPEKKCPLRLYLKAQNEPELPLSPLMELLKRLGQRHEQLHLEHLKTSSNVVDLSEIPRNDRLSETQKKINEMVDIIYQPSFSCTVKLNGGEHEISGDPDFLIRTGDQYKIRDAKFARKITQKDHPEIISQLQVYHWLFEREVGTPPVELEVFNGDQDYVPVAYEGESFVLELLSSLAEIKQSPVEPYSPVGWSKCLNCGFRDRCWEMAKTTRDISIIPNTADNLVYALRDAGTTSIEQLLDRFDENTLRDFKQPWGDGTRKVGKTAIAVLKHARAILNSEEEVLRSPEIPDSINFVMFDIENLPEMVEADPKVYIWGLKVFGEKPGEYVRGLAGFGTNGDIEGWRDFLSLAREIFDEYGDIRFVHWSSHDKTFITKYIERYGDMDGVAERIVGNLLDLHKVTKDSMVLPLPSYSLKVVEEYVGFKRTQEEYGGDWSIAKYAEAMETEDEALRNEILKQLLLYNEEDLDATWEVLVWLRTKKL